MATIENNKQYRTRHIIHVLWITFIAIMFGMVFFFTLIYNGVIGYMPPVEELKNPTDKFASVVISSDGEELGRYYQSKGNRVYVDFDEISANVTDASSPPRM